eukprot:CAMPEP_0201709916 /NCGR_PEP_ID=MMETSP0578-20130828/58352_1 /ASSEMBLY_ACC=CAM_ASM_000663 /TAXON_ID=267565 /ORGANISM="Skeletonema grethea, Strain CCMP 1804" /LENGTH=912 /DNA_ID=CAMNT_0048198913 /DNA_START=633 /DNA_END=3371 /DNA_ORIENTATION=-
MSLNSSNKEVLQTRSIHLTNEWFQRDPHILSVFVTEGIKTWYWYDYVSFVENLDEINSVKNRKWLLHYTAEYSRGGFALHEGTHHLLPILLRILVGFNNNNNNNNNNNSTDVNFIAFQLTSSLAHATIYGENLPRHDHSHDGEENIDDTTPFNAANTYVDHCPSCPTTLVCSPALFYFPWHRHSTDILPSHMQYCHSRVDSSNIDGGGLWKMSLYLCGDNILVLFWGELLMHGRTSTSMSPVDLCFADHATSFLIGNDACTINITASVVSWVIGEWFAEKTKHNVRCFYQDTLIIGTGRQDIIPSHPSSLMDIHLHDFAVVTGAFLGSIQLRRIFLPWGAALSNCVLIVLQIILHHLVNYEATAMDIGKFYAISQDTTSADVYDHGTTWGAVDESLMSVYTTVDSSATMVCTASSRTVSLPRRLLRLSTKPHLFATFLHGSYNDPFGSEISLQHSSLHCLSVVGSIKRSPCTPLANGEHLELPRCLEMNRERLPVRLQRFYCHLVVVEYRSDVSSYPSIVFQDLADQISLLYDMCRANFPACNIFHRHEAIGKDTVLLFDIEAWEEYHRCHSYIGRPAESMLMDGQFTGIDPLCNTIYLWGDATCVSCQLLDTFDPDVMGTHWIRFRHGKGKSSTTHLLPTLSAQLGNGIIILWIESCAISSAIGTSICAININARYALRINGEPIVPDRIILAFRDLVSSELCSGSADAESWSSKYLLHLIYVGCSLKPSITTTSRCNVSIGFTVGNVMRDIISIRFISVRFSDGHDQLQLHDQLQVQVTTAHRLQVQVTCDISFANSHITSSFASCDDSLNISSWTALWGEETLTEKMIVAKEELWGEILEATIEVMTGERRFGFGYVDVLHKRWRYSYTNFSLFVGLILLLLRVMGSHILHTVDLDISISCRWGVTAGE